MEEINSCSCEHCHNHSQKNDDGKKELILLALSGALFFVGIGLKFFNINFAIIVVVFFASYILCGYDIIMTSFCKIGKKNFFDENLLMTIASFGAFVIGEYPEGVAVMILYKIGEMLSEYAVEKSRKTIKSTIELRCEYANLKKGNTMVKVEPKDVEIGDTIIVTTGEKVPLDGVISKGNTNLDTKSLTGEFMPLYATVGDNILGGYVNVGKVIEIEVTKKYSDSTAVKIMQLMENSVSNKAKTEKFITKFSKYYTPIVVILALIIGLGMPIITGSFDFSKWIYKSFVFLVVSCPCALVISIPLGVFAGVGKAAKCGILIKGGNYLEALSNVDTVIFDKTGTITKGEFCITDIVPYGNTTKKELIEMVKYAEHYSNHPIAIAIGKYDTEKIDISKISDFKEVAGNGVMATINGTTIYAFNKCDKKEKITKHLSGLVIHIFSDTKYYGAISLNDTIKPNAKATIQKLKKLGIKQTVMLTGDKESSAKEVQDALGITIMKSELLPNDKVEITKQILKNKKIGKVVFVGDGMNDAPVLSLSDVGISMGKLGSDMAVEASDVVIMNDDLLSVTKAIEISKRTMLIMKQNIAFTISAKILFLILGTIGTLAVWQAVFADVGVLILAVLHATNTIQKV